MSVLDQNIRTALGLIIASRNKKADHLLYSTLNLPRQGPEVVGKIEAVDAVKATLPENMQDVAEDMKDTLLKSLEATSSIKGWNMNLLTTQKTQVSVNNPQLKRNITRNLIAGRHMMEEE